MGKAAMYLRRGGQRASNVPAFPSVPPDLSTLVWSADHGTGTVWLLCSSYTGPWPPNCTLRCETGPVGGAHDNTDLAVQLPPPKHMGPVRSDAGDWFAEVYWRSLDGSQDSPHSARVTWWTHS